MMAKRIVGNSNIYQLILLKINSLHNTQTKYSQKNHFAGCIFDCYVVIQTEGQMKRLK